MTTEEKYAALLDDVRSLASSFRSLQLQASDREAPAYEDAYEMTNDVLTTAQKRETPMSNIDKAELIILGRTATDAAKKLHAAGLLVPEPRIIRTVEELEALDIDSWLAKVDDPHQDPLVMILRDWESDYEIDGSVIFPLVVLATGESVRAAREAVKEKENA